MFYAVALYDILVPVIVLTLLIALVVVLCLLPKKNMTSREITFAATAIAASFALSYAKIEPVANGGSITLASCVPLMLYCYVYGFRRGLLAAFIYSWLQFLQAPYFLNFAQLLLDYTLPFSAMGTVSMLKGIKALKNFDILISLTIIYIFRFFCHTVAGLYWYDSATAWLPSMAYQATYIPLDLAIALITTAILLLSTAFRRLVKILQPIEAPKQQMAEATENGDNANQN